MVAVLQEASTRDKVKRDLENGKRITKAIAKQAVKSFIQNIHHYRDAYLVNQEPPYDHDEFSPSHGTPSKGEISIELIKKMVAWNRKNKRLKNHHFKYMLEVANGKLPLGDQAKRYAAINLQTLKKYDFAA